MIYIDPPYNTGKDFIYRDNRRQTIDEYEKAAGVYDEDDLIQYSPNFEANPQYHSDWYSMIYPRLQLAKNLLTDDGVIFISIDDYEVHNLRKICDEAFGENNFVGQFTWIRKKKGAFLSSKVRKMTEYVFCYSKKHTNQKFYGENAYSDKQQPLVKRTNSLKQLVFPANTVQTKLKDDNYKVIKTNEPTRILFLNEFSVVNGVVVDELITEARYVWTQEFLNNEIDAGTEIFLSSQFGFNVLRSNQSEKIKTPSTLISKDNNVGTNEDASLEISQIFNSEMGAIFDYTKPTSLIKYLINKDGSFESSPHRLNVEEIFKLNAPNTSVRVI